MKQLDLMVIEAWDQNHYQNVSQFPCELLAETDLDVGFLDYADKIDKDKRFEVIKTPKVNFPDRKYSDDFLYLIKLFYNFKSFYSDLLDITLQHTNNVIFSTYCTPVDLFPKPDELNFIPYIHRFKNFKIKSKNPFDVNDFIKPYLLRRDLKKADAVLTTEEKLKKRLSHIISSKKNYVLPAISNIDLLKSKKKVIDEFNLLSIGVIRESKNIEFLIESLEGTSHPLTIAGSIKGEYGKRIKDLIGKLDLSNISTDFYYLERDEYLNKIKNHSFVVFAQKDLGEEINTSGPMLDALLSYRPIIAPNRYPFSHYVRNYDVGILYQGGNKESFLKAVEEAKKKGVEHYIQNIERLIEKRFDLQKLRTMLREIVGRYFDI